MTTETITKEEVSQRVCAVVRAVMGKEDDEDLPIATTFLGSEEAGGLDAQGIDFLQLKFELGREFGITIPANRLFVKAGGWMEFTVSDQMNVSDVVAYICRKLGIEA